MKTKCIQCGEERDYINCKEVDCPQAFWNNEKKGNLKMATNNSSFDDFDFGFSAVTEEELKQHETQQISKLTQVAQKSLSYQDKLESMYKMILPLIANLSKDPEKEYILWPGRDKKLAEFKAKLDALMNG